MNRHAADVEIVFERDSVARFLGFDEAAAARFIQGSRDPSSNPAVFSTATYHGSSVAAAKNGGANWATLHIDFADASGDSRAYFRVVLPTEFTSEAAAASPTSDVVRVGHTDVPETELCTHHFAGIAKRHGARRRAKTADASGPLAQTASVGVSADARPKRHAPDRSPSMKGRSPSTALRGCGAARSTTPTWRCSRSTRSR